MTFLIRRAFFIGLLTITAAIANPLDPKKMEIPDQQGIATKTPPLPPSTTSIQNICINNAVHSNLHLIPVSDSESDSDDEFNSQSTARLESNLHLIPVSDSESDSDDEPLFQRRTRTTQQTTKSTKISRKYSEAFPQAETSKEAPPKKKQKKHKHDGINLSTGVCWRIDPNDNTKLQILDTDDKVIFSEKIINRFGKRRLNCGQLDLQISSGTRFIFSRHPNDQRNLTTLNFKINAGDRISVYNAPNNLTVYKNLKLKDIKNWRVHPGKPRHFQLLGENDNVLYSGPVQTQQGKRLVKNGVIILRIANKQSRIHRHKDDNADLEANDFRFTTGNRSVSKYEDTNLEEAVCWRVSPTQKGILEILNKKREIIYSDNIETSRGKRLLVNGYLKIKHKKASYCLKRDQADTANLSQNGFVADQTCLRVGEKRVDTRLIPNLDEIPMSDDEEGEMEFQRTTLSGAYNLDQIVSPSRDDDSDEDGLPGGTSSDMDESDDDDGYPLPMD